MEEYKSEFLNELEGGSANFTEEEFARLKVCGAESPCYGACDCCGAQGERTGPVHEYQYVYALDRPGVTRSRKSRNVFDAFSYVGLCKPLRFSTCLRNYSENVRNPVCRTLRGCMTAPW